MSNNKFERPLEADYRENSQLSVFEQINCLDSLSLQDWKAVFPGSARRKDANSLIRDGQLFFTPPDPGSAASTNTGAGNSEFDRRHPFRTNGASNDTNVQPEKSESAREISSSKEDFAELSRRRESLDNAARMRFSPDSEEYKSFAENMKRLEARASSGSVSPKEIVETYKQTERLLIAGSAKVGMEERKVLAQNLIYHAADPKNIDQGVYNTCNVCTIQENLFTKHPSIATEMVVTTALYGQWRSRDGMIIKIAPESLVPMPESKVHPPADGERSYATQVINNVLVNDVVQRRVPANFYQQVRENTDGSPLTGSDNGERLLFKNGQECQRDAQGKIVSENGIPVREPDLTSSDMAIMQEQMTGERKTILTNSETAIDPDLTVFRSKEELEESLQDLKSAGKLPAIVMVDANNPAFGGEGGGTAGWHVVCITGYDYKTGMVQISNQWGSDGDRAISVENLYESTLDHSVKKDGPILCDSAVPAESNRQA